MKMNLSSPILTGEEEPNVLFALTDCFNTIDAKEGFNEVICYNNVIIFALSIINLALVCYVTFLHFRVGRAQHTCG